MTEETKEITRLLIECMDEIRLYEMGNHQLRPELKDKLKAFWAKYGFDDCGKFIETLCAKSPCQEPIMKLFFPVFGHGEYPHVCKKWAVQAENAEDALKIALEYFDKLSPITKVFFCPYPDQWVGPLHAVEEANFHGGVVLLN